MMIFLQIFVKKTRLGKAMRAVPQDRDAAVLYGINVNFIITVTFAIGSALAAVAALMYCSTYPRVTNDMGSMMGIKAFIAAVLGGIGVIPGAMLGGILIGLIEIFVKLFAPGWYEAVTYGLLIVILLVKPSGILGKNAGEKV
jgi:branched-chain amino acid transport system permease protein